LLAIVFQGDNGGDCQPHREQSSVDRLLLQKMHAWCLKTGNKKPGRRTFRVFCLASA